MRQSLVIPAEVHRLRHTTARHGELHLTFTKSSAHTVMTESQFRPPLQVMRAVTDAAGCACVYILSPTGGIVQGDRYTIGVTVEEDAHALVTTLAATKIYRMPNEHAEQHVHIEVKPGAILEFVPDAAILFRDADFRQSIHITLHGGALLMFHDSVMPGRLASGESLQFRRFRNRLTVTDPHGLLLYEQQDVQPQVQALTRVGTLEQFRCWAGWYLLGDLDRIGLDARAFCENYQPPDDVLASASRLYRNGVSVRLLAGYWSPLSQALDQLRNTIRRDFMHLPATNLRK